MKKIFGFIAASFAIVAAASCSQEQELSPIGNADVRTFTVNIDATKATADVLGKVTWEAGDEIAVYAADESRYVLTLTNGAGTASGTFEGKCPAESDIASVAYPVEPNASMNQTIAAGATCDPKALAMEGTVSGSTITMHNAVGGLQFTVPDYIYSVDLAFGTDTYKVTLPGTAGTYFMFLKEGNYSDVTAIAHGPVNVFSYNSDKTLSIQKNKILNLGELATKMEVCTQITDAATLQAWLSAPETSGYIANDIDLTDVTITPCDILAKSLYGGGHSLTNWTCTAALITTNNGVIKDLNIASGSATISTDVFGVLCKTNAGTIANCSNAIDMSSTTARAAGAVGAIAAQSTGRIVGCGNSGNINIQAPTISGVNYYGGVVGQVAISAVESTKVLVEACENSGNVVVHCAAKPGNAYIGGVVGGNTATKLVEIKNIGSIVDCVNRGQVAYSFATLGNGTYTDVGGVVGYWDGNASNLTNYGKVSYTTPTSDTSVCATSPSVGGAAGIVVFNVKNCTNYGDIDITGVWSAGTDGNAGAGISSSPAFSGVVGKNGTSTSAANNNIIVENCTNEGKITGDIYMKASGNTSTFVAGVIGYSNAKLSNLVNKGAIDASINTKNSYLGGISGYYSGSEMKNCKNSGSLKNSVNSIMVGSAHVCGILAYSALNNGQIIESCVNDGNLELGPIATSTTAYQYAAGIMTNYKGSCYSQKLRNCVNNGTITANTDRKVRVGGIVGAIYDNSCTLPTVDATDSKAPIVTAEGVDGTNNIYHCVNNGDIIINGAGNPANAIPGSIIGGIASYCSVGMDGCENHGNITLKGCHATTAASHLAAAPNRVYSFKNCVVDGALTSDVADNKLGFVAGSLYSNDLKMRLTIGAEGAPVTIKSTAKINGVGATSPAVLDELVADVCVGAEDTNNYKAQEAIINNVVVE